MINVTDEVKQAYNESTTQVDRIIVNDASYRIMNVDYNDDCYEEGNIFGTAIARMLEFEIENIIDLEKKEIEYQTGIYINNKVYWISLGSFIIQDIEPNDTTNINKVTAMDYMLKSNVLYTSKLDYQSGKVTLFDVANEACKIANLELATTNFANSDFIVDSNQFEEGTLVRDVLKAIAQISGTFAKIRNDNKLYFVTPKKTGLQVKEVNKMLVKELNKLPVYKLYEYKDKYATSTYKELLVKRRTHPINLVSLGMSDIEGENITSRDEESIDEDGENSLIINDNPFAYTQEKREQLIDAIFDVVKGFEYVAFEIEGQSKPYFETGDEVLIVDKDKNVRQSFLFRFRYKSPNGLESEMSAPSLTKATINYQNEPSSLDIAKKTERMVDKQNQIISDLVQQQTETEEKMTKYEQTVDEIEMQVKNVKQEAIDEATKNANANVEEKLEEYTVTVKSLIEMQATNLLAEVSAEYAKKSSLDEVDKRLTASLELKVDTEKLISEINASADVIRLTSGRLIISSGNFKLDESGNITAIGGTIGGFTLNSTQFSGNLNGTYEYNLYDLSMIRAYIMNSNSAYFPSTLLNLLDVNNSGGVDSTDYARIKNIISGTTSNTKTMTGTVKIDSKNPKNCISINNNGTLSVSLGIGGVNANMVTTQSIICSRMANSNSSFTGILMNGSTATITFVSSENELGTIKPYSSGIGVSLNSGYSFYIVNSSNSTVARFEQNSIYFFKDLYIGNYSIHIGSDTQLMHFSSGGGIKADDYFYITNGANVTAMSVDTKGACVNSYYNLDMHGYTILNAANMSSDGRLKKGIYTSKINAIDRIMQMKHREYTWKKDEKHEEISYIAQELEQIDPNYVRHNYAVDNGKITMDSYEVRVLPILATTTMAIQEHQKVMQKQQLFMQLIAEKLNMQEEYNSIFKQNCVKLMNVQEEETIFEGEVIYGNPEVLEV